MLNRINALIDFITQANYEYYVLDNPSHPDSVYDRKFRELQTLGKEHPELVTEDWPTEKVGHRVVSHFGKVDHMVPMLSLDNSFSYGDLESWEGRVCKGLGEAGSNDLEYCCEPKFDGLAVNLIYTNGVLTKAGTRGDGLIGEDVTHCIRVIEDIPAKLDTETPPKLLEIRGEVYMSNSAFNELNERMLQEGKKVYLNPRNAAAGSLRQLDASVTSSRKLSFFPYSIGKAKPAIAGDSHYENLLTLEKYGFSLSSYVRKVKGIAAVHDYCTDLGALRDNLEYAIDGGVAKVNSLKLQDTLGFTGRIPRWGMAFKFPAQEEISTLLDVKFQVGRYGQITPVGELVPTLISGVMVSSATLHNADEIKRLGICYNDRVIVRRAGDVVPQIMSVVEGMGECNDPVVFPTICPSCGGPLVRDPEFAVTRCEAGLACRSQRIQYLTHYVSRRVMDIRGLSVGLITKLVDGGFVKTPADLYSLPLEAIGGKLAKKLNAAIEDSKRTTLARFIYALGIREIGEAAARNFANHFGTLEAFRKADYNELTSIRDIGEVVANHVLAYLDISENNDLIEQLISKGLNWEEHDVMSDNGPKLLEGKTIVITGTLDTMTKEDLSEKLRGLGANISKGVSKKTWLTVVGMDAGSKKRKSEELGIPMVSETDILELITHINDKNLESSKGVDHWLEIKRNGNV